MSQHQSAAEEVDLGFLFKGVRSFFRGLGKVIYNIIQVFLRNIILLAVILIVGVVLGYLLDSSSLRTYENRLIVIPNFESVDYLYDIVDEINFKRQIKDAEGLKEIFGEDYEDFKKVEIEPIPDIYNFITKSRENIDVFRILFENQKLDEFVENMVTSKQYKYQRLKIFVAGDQPFKLIDHFLEYLNTNEHFLAYQEVYKENTIRRIDETNKMITQADSLLSSIASTSGSDVSTFPVYASFNNDFFNIFRYKQTLLIDQLELEKRVKDEISVVKPVSRNYNIYEPGWKSVSNKIKIPLYLLILFSLFMLFRFLYKEMKKVATEESYG